MLHRSERVGGKTETDFEDLVRINTNRILYIWRVSELWILGISCAVLTALGLLGFVYNVEFSQAVFLLAFPLFFVGILSIRTAEKIEQEALHGVELRRRLKMLRIYIQGIGVVSIFVTAMWGMYQNINLGPLGG